MDSPAGLAAWIGEKFRIWSDCGGDPLKSFSRDELLTNMTIYWVTKTINSSTRLYYESQKSGSWGAPETRVEVPTGCALFPSELFRPPRSWADRSYNIVQWTEMPSGGHFAALEEPELLIEDIRSLYRKLRWKYVGGGKDQAARIFFCSSGWNYKRYGLKVIIRAKLSL